MISIVLPVCMQADHIAAVVASYHRALAGIDGGYELVLSVNCAGDESLEICRELERQDDRCRTIWVEPPGWGRAVRSGLLAARGDLLCFANSARTQADRLLRFVQMALRQPDMVFAAERLERDNTIRIATSYLHNLQCRLLFGIPTRDVHGTPKVFPRSFARLLELGRDDWLCNLEFHLICQEAGYPVIEVPVAGHARHGGRTSATLRTAYDLYTGAFEMWWHRRRARRARGAQG